MNDINENYRRYLISLLFFVRELFVSCWMKTFLENPLQFGNLFWNYIHQLYFSQKTDSEECFKFCVLHEYMKYGWWSILSKNNGIFLTRVNEYWSGRHWILFGWWRYISLFQMTHSIVETKISWPKNFQKRLFELATKIMWVDMFGHFFFDNVKIQVYKNKPQTIPELKD